MNRLIIIGNGFDLAHGLPTSYNDFIDDYWKEIIKKVKSDLIYVDDFISISFEYLKYDMWSHVDWDAVTDIKSLLNTSSKAEMSSYDFKNQFFKNICEKSIENWVDIENEYYKMLKLIIKKIPSNNQEKLDKVTKLNNEFEKIKNLLEKYLIEKVEKTNNHQNNQISNIFDISEKKTGLALKEYLEEFPKEDEEDLIEQNNKLKDDYQNKIIQRIKDGEINHQTIFLNFNYTSTIKKYTEYLEYEIYREIQIHGEVGNKNNLINLGFGDEMDDNYKEIENLDDNEFLRYFKSFRYLQNNKYKKLLDFIETSKFQTYLMGHSCGLSDRTLLNTIFEHPNCRSIKIFYHKKDNGEDNYTEIVQNISRHFNKKKLMREKIVNKTLCKPLPQL